MHWYNPVFVYYVIVCYYYKRSTKEVGKICTRIFLKKGFNMSHFNEVVNTYQGRIADQVQTVQDRAAYSVANTHDRAQGVLDAVHTDATNFLGAWHTDLTNAWGLFTSDLTHIITKIPF